MPQSNQMKRTDSLTQSFNQPFKNVGGGHPQVMANVQSQQHLQGGIPGGTHTAQLQGIAKLIEPGVGDFSAGNVEYTQSKYRKRLNQQQSHDYQAGMPITSGGKGKLALQGTVGTQGRAPKKLMATQHATSTGQAQSKLVSTHVAQSQTQRTHGKSHVTEDEMAGPR